MIMAISIRRVNILLLCEIGFREPIFELNGHDPQSVRQVVDYLAALSEQEEEAGEKTYHS